MTARESLVGNFLGRLSQEGYDRHRDLRPVPQYHRQDDLALGRLDPAGRLIIVDRAKDVVITGGENVSSREVEDALSAHPDVDSVAVVGVPDEHWGEAICAVVVPRAGRAPSAADLVAHVRASTSAFKRPRHVLFVNELPLTTNAKIAKDQVRALARARLGIPPPPTPGG